MKSSTQPKKEFQAFGKLEKVDSSNLDKDSKRKQLFVFSDASSEGCYYHSFCPRSCCKVSGGSCSFSGGVCGLRKEQSEVSSFHSCLKKWRKSTSSTLGSPSS